MHFAPPRFPQGRNVAAEDRQARQARFQDGDAEALVGAGKQQRVGQLIQVGHRIVVRRDAQLVEKVRRLFQPQLASQVKQVLQISGIGGVVRAGRAGDDETGVVRS